MEVSIENLAITKAETALSPLQETSASSMLNNSGYTWQELGIRPARHYHAMVYDSARGKVILFGGFIGSYLNDTWSYDPVANSWTNLNPANPPSTRYGHAMVYDSARGKVILFGGYSGSYLNDTWSYDPVANSWTNLNPANPPSARDYHAMVYDSSRGKVILFGGYSSVSNDTWSYDPVANSWTNLNPANPPSTRYGHAMVYDSSRGKVILFGGYSGSYLNDTWSYRPRLPRHGLRLLPGEGDPLRGVQQRQQRHLVLRSRGQQLD
ncbi:MAG: hypothetical protein NTV33_12730 [Coprothermobacterota bacterium]|nr:hypothetical protein [Coprothermobacterota bacterium]